MNRSYFVLFSLFIVKLFGGTIYGAAVPFEKPLEVAIDRAMTDCVNQDMYADVSVGISVKKLATKPVEVWSTSSANKMIPASALKVFTTAIALISMGKDHYQDTPILTDGVVLAGVVEGNVYLVGKGDPCLKAKHIQAAVDRMKNQGIYVINGDICYDTTFIKSEEPRLLRKARHYYAPPSALTIDRNSIRLRMEWSGKPRLVPRKPTSYAQVVSAVKFKPAWLPGLPEMEFVKKPWGDKYTIKGKVTKGDLCRGLARVLVTRPGLYGATVLRDKLKAAGVTVTGSIRQASTPRKSKRLVSMHTAPLLQAVNTINGRSCNVLAELVTRLLGAKLVSAPGTAEKGMNVLNAYVRKQLGFKEKDYRLVDACGLSSENRMTASQFTDGLAHFHRRLGITFVRTLPRLGHHFSVSRPQPPKGIEIYLKTGVLPVNGVNTAVGYLVHQESNSIYAFSLLANKRNPTGRTGDRELVTPLLEALSQAFGPSHNNDLAAAD